MRKSFKINSVTISSKLAERNVFRQFLSILHSVVHSDMRPLFVRRCRKQYGELPSAQTALDQSSCNERHWKPLKIKTLNSFPKLLTHTSFDFIDMKKTTAQNRMTMKWPNGVFHVNTLQIGSNKHHPPTHLRNVCVHQRRSTLTQWIKRRTS